MFLLASDLDGLNTRNKGEDPEPHPPITEQMNEPAGANFPNSQNETDFDQFLLGFHWEHIKALTCPQQNS